jgi:hypothetical protein
LNSDDKIIADAIKGLFSGLGKVVKGIFHLSKSAIETPSVKGISVGGNQKELEQYYLKCKSDFENSRAVLYEVYDLAEKVIKTGFENAEKQSHLNFYKLPQPILELIVDTTVTAIKKENLFNFPKIDFSKELLLSEQIELKQQLEALDSRISDDEGMFAFWHSFENVIKHFVLSLETIARNDNAHGGNIFNAELIHLTTDLNYHLERMIISFFTDTNAEIGLFAKNRRQFLINLDVVSGLGSDRTPEERQTETSKVKLPTEIDLTGQELVTGYLKNTYLENIFTGTTEFSIPLSLRYEHCHIIAGTGHGKTQLIQKLVLDDIDNNRGFMVIDSQGDIIRKISMLKVFDPDTANSLADKFILIDPEDVEFPVALNMFSLGSNIDNENLSELHKQMLINSSIDLYEYLFGAIFGAELTSKQGTIFRYVAKLMAEIPNATIHTLRHLMEDGKKYQEYIDKLDGSAKDFFTTQFFSTSFAQTKKQILSRLWAVLSNQTLENLFSSKENKINIFEAINEGKIILVNTSKSLLQAEGSKILGRFFISMTAQAVIKRATIPENERNPFMLYIDEAQEYIDEKIEDMLNQARKYKVGFTLSHQNLNQLGSLKHTVFSSTSIKLAGGISAKDSQDLALEMKTTKDNLLSVKKVDGKFAEFSCYLKNHFNHAIPLSFDFGLLEKREVLSSEAYSKLIGNIRDKYCTTKAQLDFGTQHITKIKQEEVSKNESLQTTKSDPQIIQETEIPKEAEPVKQQELIEQQKKAKPKLKTQESLTPEIVNVKPQGKGGLQHQYLQNLVKKIGQERGYHSVIENPVFGGIGAVDISLDGFDTKIAVEVSVNTKSKWESSNISKCFSASFDYVVILSSERQHLNKIRDDISSEFKDKIKKGRLLFFTADDLIEFLDKIKAGSATTESTVSGYKVKTSFTPLSKEETEIREESLARVIFE